MRRRRPEGLPSLWRRRDSVTANLENGSSGDEDANHGGSHYTVAEEGADRFPPGSRLGGNDFRRSPNNSFCFQLGSKRNPHAIRGSDFRGQFPRRVDETGEIRNVIAAIAAFGQMRARIIRKRLQPFLLQNKFYVFALHGTSLRG